MSFASSGAGAGRDPWVIRRHLDLKNTNMSQIAKKLQLSPAMVQQTVKGSKNNRRVLAMLRELGCPVEALSLPEDMKPETDERS